MSSASDKAKLDLQKDTSALDLLADARSVIDEKRPFYNAIGRRIFGDKFDPYVDAIDQYQYFVTAGGDAAIARRRQTDKNVAPKVKEGARKILISVINETPIDVSEIIRRISESTVRVAGEAYSDIKQAGKDVVNDIVKPTAYSGMFLIIAAIAFIAISRKK